MINIIFTVFLLIPCLSHAAPPQDTPEAAVLPQDLNQGLQGLRDSVDQLSASNKVVALRNVQLNGRLNDAKLVFQKLAQENKQLTDATAKFQENLPAKAKQITQLEKDLADAGNTIKDLDAQITDVQDQVNNKRKEIQQLTDQVNQELESPVLKEDAFLPELSELWQQKRKERLGLLKMIAESQDHQNLLQEKMLDFKRSSPVAGVSQEVNLEAQIKQLQEEINQLRASRHSTQETLSQERLAELEASVSALEKNRDELRSLVSKIQQKVRQMTLAQSPDEEELKLQTGIDQLKQESKDLKVDLMELQQQMVDLDKRKTHLQSLIKK